MIDYAGSYGGLTFGPGGQVAVVALEGWFGPPRRADTDLELVDGVALGRDRRQPRAVQLVVGLRTHTAAEFPTLLASVIRALGRDRAPLTIGDLTTDAVVIEAPATTDPAWPGPERHLELPIGLLCPDPRLYSTTETEWEIGGATQTVVHAGNEMAPWRLVVDGPCVAPRVGVDGDPDLSWGWDLVLGAGQQLVVDQRARTALIVEEGEEDVSVWHLRSDLEGRPGIWWGVLPGGTGVVFDSVSGASSAALLVRDTWL